MSIDLTKLLGDPKPKQIGNIACLILGESKIGKSTFAASTAKPDSKTIMINFENGLSFIGETEDLRIFPNNGNICTIDNLRNLYTALKESPGKYKNIVFDTGDEFWNILVSDFLKEENRSSLQIQDYVPLYAKYLNTLKKFKSLGLNVFITAHVKRFEDNPKKVLALGEKLSKQVSAWVDMILHLTVEQGERVLYTDSNTLLDAGHRSLNKRLPEKIKNPNWSNIYDLLAEEEKIIELKKE